MVVLNELAGDPRLAEFVPVIRLQEQTAVIGVHSGLDKHHAREGSLNEFQRGRMITGMLDV